ncbi:MAG TPA: penicillin-binding transpeptidase domain-containing protein [Mycobacteriales bacterium]|nr:penicillin-binding transpeptidase domain-containing protein [Mycobacteriales bacterium]
MAYRGYSYSRPRRSRQALPLVILVVVALLAGGGYLGVQHVLDQRKQARERSYAEAVAVAHGFLAAWGTGDTATMVNDATADTAPLVRDRIPSLRTDLQVVSAKYVPGTVHTDAKSGTPGAPFHASVVLRGLGTWSYNSAVVLRKVAGHWKVVFSPETIHPQLHGADQLVRQRTLGHRGSVLLANGVPLRGQDAELDGNLLGTVGKYSAAQAAAAGPLYEAGDVGGLTGLERGENAVLSGTPGGSLSIHSPGGGVITTLIDRKTTDGKDVRVSFDLHVQRAAEQALATITGGRTGSFVAIDVASGKVLAIANHPLNGFGRAIRGHYPPGSTFKVITTTAALMSGKGPGTPLDCGATTTVDGRTFHNAEKEQLGTIDLQTAFAKSCNTAFVNLERQLPSGALGKAAALFGFSPQPAAARDSPNSGPLPLTSFGGSVPTPTDAADAAAEAIGQGRIVASPLQMASVAAAVAAGTWRQPYVTDTEPAGNPHHVLPSGVAATLSDFMAQVVATGTAKASGLPGGTRGKTGTAEIGNATPPITVAWFIGFQNGIAFACQVGGDGGLSGGFGADTAAPVAARFLTLR